MNIDIPAVCQSLKSHLKFNLTKSGNISVATIPGFVSKSNKGFMRAIFDSRPEIEAEFSETEAIFLRSGKFDGAIMRHIGNEIASEQEVDLTAINYDSKVDSKLSDLRYIHNLTNPKGSALYHTKLDVTLSHKEPTIWSRLKALLGGEAEASQWLLQYTHDCIVQPVFLNPNRLIDSPDQLHTTFNTWSHPDWLPLYLANNEFPEVSYEELPQIVRDFFAHFFITEESFQWFLHWTRDVLFNRSEVMCVFVAEKGTGKNIMVENFLAGLLSPDNILPIGEGFQKNHFQDGIQKNQLLFFDEFEVNNKIKSKFKRLLNARGTLEAKTVQAGDPVEFKFSMVMCSNNWLEFELDLNDRRFCTLDITNTPLKKVWSEDRIEELCKVFADPEFQFHMVSYLSKLPAGKANTPLVTETFEKICRNTLPGWFQRFIEYCKYHKRFNKKEFHRGVKGYQTTEPTLQRELLNYKQMTDKAIATVRKHPTHEWVVTSKIYDPKLVEELERIEDEEEERL